ncbi:hypothetical protein [Acetobacter persici]|uniref:Uncharacterized protein n=1 Tax=Acetobacter persici TaxID=1076596 RepID=A0A1U9LJH3_9PROT|nr:hypothetical protein [Acetobacter persici]AQT06548.1 hypothetical protein A0U91_16200 [Acetobacter persici]
MAFIHDARSLAWYYQDKKNQFSFGLEMTISFVGKDVDPLKMPADNLKALVCVTVARACGAWAHQKLNLSRVFGLSAKWLAENCEPLHPHFLSEWSKGYFFPVGTGSYEAAANILARKRPSAEGPPNRGNSVIHPDGNLCISMSGDGYLWMPTTDNLGEWVRIYSTEKTTRNRVLRNEYYNGREAVAGDYIKLKETTGWINASVSRPTRGKILHIAKGSALVQWEGQERLHYLLASLLPCEELLPEDAPDTSTLSPSQANVYNGIVSGQYSFEKRWNKDKQLVVLGKSAPLSTINALIQKGLLPDNIMKLVSCSDAA